VSAGEKSWDANQLGAVMSGEVFDTRSTPFPFRSANFD
jgi:hypothetical protein